MPITLPTGITIRTVTFWYPAAHKGIDDWASVLSGIFDDEFRPDPRLLAHTPQTRQTRALLAAPGNGRPTRCAGGRLNLLDLAATGAEAARQARSRHQTWSRTSTIRGRRPGPAEKALLHAGPQTYITYYSLRRVVGDALIIMRTGARMYPAGHSPQALIDYVHQATLLLADAAPNDVLVTVTT